MPNSRMRFATLSPLSYLCALTLCVGFLHLERASAQCFENPAGSGNYTTTDGKPCVNTISTAVPFLRITPDARSGAMGDAGLATTPDANSIYLNASKLAFADKSAGLSFTYTPWLRALGLTDVYMAYGSGYARIDKLQTVGFAVRYFSLGKIDFTDDSGNSIGGDSPNEFEITGAYARKLSKNFSGALSFKYIYSRLSDGRVVNGYPTMPISSVAADVSLYYKKPMSISGMKSNLTIGAAVTNVGPKVSYIESTDKDFIPTNLGLGGALMMDLDTYNSLTVTADFNKLLVPTPPIGDAQALKDYKQISPIDGMFKSLTQAPGGSAEKFREIAYSFGLEYWYDKQFAVRAGYFFEDPTKGNRHYLTVGLGLRYNIFGLNFSYLVPTTSQRNPLDNTLRFSLLFDFAAFKNEADPSK